MIRGLHGLVGRFREFRVNSIAIAFDERVNSNSIKFVIVTFIWVN